MSEEFSAIIQDIFGVEFYRDIIFAKYATTIQELLLLEEDDFKRMKTEPGAIAARINRLRNIVDYHSSYTRKQTIAMGIEEYENLRRQIKNRCSEKYLQYFDEHTSRVSSDIPPTTNQ